MSAAQREPARGVQALWPFVAAQATVVVRPWSALPSTAPGDALVLTPGDLPTDGAALRRLMIEAHDRLGPGAGIGLLADNPWRALLKGRRPLSAGLRTLRGALARAGFVYARLYAVAPGAADPYALRPSGALAALRAPAWLVTARRAGASSARLLETLAPRLVAAGALPAGSRVRSVLCSGKDKTLVFLGAGDARWLARLPWSAGSAAAEARAHDALGTLCARPALAPLLPRPLRHDRFGAQEVLLETLVRGRPLSTQLTEPRRSAFAAEARHFLDLLNPAPDAFCDDLMARFGRPLLARLAPHLDDLALLAALDAALEQALAGVRCRLGWVHGDFGSKNIFVDGGRISGVVDWENAHPDAPVVLDVMSYLDSAERRVRRGQTLADTIPRLAAGAWPQAGERNLLERELAITQIDKRGRRGLALLYWLTHVAGQLDFQATDERDRNRVAAVLRWALQPAS